MVIAKERLAASATHLGISLCIAAAAALLVFGYPWPYREMSGGRNLFLILTGVVLGRLITLAIFDRRRSVRELALDLNVPEELARHTLYLPVVSRRAAWTAFLDPKTARIIGFAPLDSF
jgi:hypothetical protein